ncbi:prepilin-type N-terminal cleavage/methylation domain-containing protein [Salibacterium salarium]|uniref:ComG operon protein 3 n=1 Tax=Salibacterium salarium TaxID=284579 RepID=A0A3R9Q0D7_9BACI|nr:competence type IV pilus major pilin ComGC [Salibacterium salarium]RSL30942.1 prepilin-type N-terminal cleavage/methylation domain-containing protein [Salibacterium salarium]
MNKTREQLGFTMIEMMVVLLIITVLLLIAVPNLMKNNEIAQSKGCEATVKLIQSQVGAYEVEHLQTPESLDDLKEEEYVDRIVCPDNSPLTLGDDGKVEHAAE